MENDVQAGVKGGGGGGDVDPQISQIYADDSATGAMVRRGIFASPLTGEGDNRRFQKRPIPERKYERSYGERLRTSAETVYADIDRTLGDVSEELDMIMFNRLPLHSVHEGLAHLLGEMRFLESEVFRPESSQDLAAIRGAAIAVAAVAVRLVVDRLPLVHTARGCAEGKNAGGDAGAPGDADPDGGVFDDIVCQGRR